MECALLQVTLIVAMGTPVTPVLVLVWLLVGVVVCGGVGDGKDFSGTVIAIFNCMIGSPDCLHVHYVMIDIW